MTKRCSVLALVCLIGAVCFGEGTATWVLAAQPFTLAQKNAPSAPAAQFATVLPQLLLEQISLDGTRVLPSQEVLDRQLETLQTERLSLFLQLSKEYQSRDALVLTHDKPKKLAKALAQAQEKIDDIQKKIDENLAAADAAKDAFRPKIDREAAVARGEDVADEQRQGWRFPFFFGDGESEQQQETVTICRADSTSLFAPSADALAEGVTSRAYEKEVTGAKINGVLSGSITGYGEYLAVSVDLYVYPGAKRVGSVTEVGTVGDQMDLADRIVQKLVPAIANSLPVVLRFEVVPEEAALSASLTLDGLVYSRIPETLQVDASVHTISVAAKDFESVSFTYKYEGNERYRIRFSLSPARDGVLNLRLKKERDGIFYPKGFDRQVVDGQHPAARVTVNGTAVIGVFTAGEGDDAASAFFYIPESLAQDGANLKVNAKPFDRAENIDKRRRRMYTAYSALICSLPFTFYCTGNFTAANNAYVLGRGSYDNAQKWQTYGYVASGISIACGVWAVFELVRYLWAANQVLPATARTDSRDYSAWEAEETAGTAEALTADSGETESAEQDEMTTEQAL